ncbi:hypothetical protein BALAC2494_02016 [Bifidobacterium animalis subsp. lactis CNCM I-2494]|uniref:Uncharacterized protein n=1 Tax=Bifidobacterium animalis subsp. lactis CNCM I-2494 TaxID=1042403 RepID=A0A806FLP3_BIFAN|nr:hypothetical protein BALAC2494_02016 [Bifidobacterium animalis subsp. lactis CNCM I-2494]
MIVYVYFQISNTPQVCVVTDCSTADLDCRSSTMQWIRPQIFQYCQAFSMLECVHEVHR